MSNPGLNAPSPVLVDTDVFSRVFIAVGTNPERQRWDSALAGRTITIAVQTEVELRAWPLLKGWGAKRTATLEQQLESIGTIQITSAVQAKFVELTVWAKTNGHGIQDKAHTGDRSPPLHSPTILRSPLGMVSTVASRIFVAYKASRRQLAVRNSG